MNLQDLRKIHLGDLGLSEPKIDTTKNHKSRKQVITPKITQAKDVVYKEEPAEEVTRELLGLLVKKLLGMHAKDVDHILGSHPETPTKYVFDTIVADTEDEINALEKTLSRLFVKGSDTRLKPQTQVNAILSELYDTPINISTSANTIVLYGITISRPLLNRTENIVLAFGLERGVVI